jgi:hypothetical protein
LPIAWLAAAVVAFGLLVGPTTAQGPPEDVRSLLREMGVQLPTRPVSPPPFSLPDLGGNSRHLAEQRGRLVILYFWTTY